MDRKKRRISREKIRRVGQILEEFLIGNFESEFPVSSPSVSPPGAAEPQVQVGGPRGEVEGEGAEPDREDADEEPVFEEDEDELLDEAQFYFDLADVEYCVDVTITEIVNEKLVPGYSDPLKPPTLSEVFETLFGEEDQLTKQVEEFEELISGYDDHVHIDDLEQAYNVMSEIVKELEQRSKN